jgi:hypothetical protein
VRAFTTTAISLFLSTRKHSWPDVTTPSYMHGEPASILRRNPASHPPTVLLPEWVLECSYAIVVVVMCNFESKHAVS